MNLVHRTNYWGRCIDPSSRDKEVPFPVIWTQCAYRHGGCCRGFGCRAVSVLNSDFVNDFDGRWRLYKISENAGYSDGHYFYKFVALPAGMRGNGKRSCSRRGWTYLGDFSARNAVQELRSLLKPYQRGDYSDYDINHIHIGLMFDDLAA
uniref:Uncharacterized protein n=1 Tax=Cyclophora tenuis TaxID=216820 RepID=A0A7S1D9F6_CYCTE|mmetsp:Transcript_3626/g.6184  ORF Transcript_3626/g.6184 Transcript_3626/m.6184 type:complete len:150 (+) Transcript_3626:98-547(+)